MEQILKIQSEQAFQEIAKPGEFINAKLADFIIPGNTGAYDLSKSYININVGLDNAANTATGAGQPASATADDTALYNNEIAYQGDAAGNTTIVPTSAIVRNADMFSNNRGMVESIRRVNTLRQILWNFENDKAEQHDGLDKIGTFEGRRGKNNQTSSFVQIIGSNVNNAGVADTTKKAQLLTRDLRIPLSDLFGVGNAMWNSDYFGDTRIHLEVEPNLLAIQQLGGSETADSGATDGTNALYGGMVAYNGAGLGQLPNGGTLGVSAPLVTLLSYTNFQLDFPFYVGQAVRVTATAATGGAQDKNTIIDSIEYNNGTNGTNPPNGTGQVKIILRDAVYTNATGGGENVTAVEMLALKSDATNDKIEINRAEIVLTQLPGVNAPEGIDYRTYSTEETQVVDQTSFNKQIIVEPNCDNLIIAHCPSGKTMPSEAWTSYRLAINNVDVCGNRDVPYSKPIHEDRLLRFFNNRSQNVSNMSLVQIETAKAQDADANQLKYYPILETMPLTRDEKLVNLELNSAAAKDVIFFKELVKSI